LTRLSFDIDDGSRVAPVIRRLVLAGYAGRGREHVEAHIEEMARQGVRRPGSVPTLWPVLPHLLTQAPMIEVYGTDTVPEVEYVLFTSGGHTYVTVGNDQCDVAVERDGSPEKSKNLCPKVVARTAWRLDEVLSHWDDLILSLACEYRVMQQGRLADLLRPGDLLTKVAESAGADREGRMVFSGTIVTQGIYPAGPYRLDLALDDPVAGRSISHSVTVSMLAPLKRQTLLRLGRTRSVIGSSHNGQRVDADQKKPSWLCFRPGCGAR
jgi:hypothetical protein